MLKRCVRWALILAGIFYGAAALGMMLLRAIDPFTTAVHVERRIQSWIHHAPYTKRYEFLPLARISPAFQHAVIAAEDTRFYQHHGFDWREVQDAVEDGLEEGKLRGASTITQQLVKNLFLGTWHSGIRKVVEIPLVPLAELILGKQRILELYVNVVEWGPGVYGAEAAAHYHYRVPAARITREQGARLAAILPAPLRRKPARMGRYTSRILTRMSQLRW
ncbi:MAG TPA: monofunctional biosynthetic peptidoglycan transglycosylase [Bryobacteraceae bacterium]|nr:monofunctional biosynthetic peptidoglycan transglycosylase [Bryobacteraceae bacterium]